MLRYNTKLCLKSINTENQERLFQQAKSIASKCSNRKPDNVISSVLLRLQAREISGKLSNMYGKVESRVGSVASKSATSYYGTTVSKTFIEERPHSCQAHLSRISSFLIHLQIWWKEEPENFVFFDVTMIPIIGMKVLSSNILGPVSFRILKNNRLIIGSI